MKKNICTGCYKPLEGHICINGDRQPMKDDYSVCFYCGTIGQFDEDLNLVPMAPADVMMMAGTDFENFAILQKARAEILKRIKKQ